MNSRLPLSVVHVAPHAGGGVGTVLRAFIKHSMDTGKVRHALCTLESLNSSMRQWCVAHGIEYFENGWQQGRELVARLNRCDIVNLHWWNHPLLHALLATSSLPEMRTVLWAHVNGMFVPQMFFKALLEFPDYFVLATPFSWESPLVRACSRPPGIIRLIRSNGGVPPEVHEERTKPAAFSAGYIGTVDYCKMHGDFIDIWRDTGITAPPLLVCGGPSHAELQEEVVRQEVAHLFDIRGMVQDVPEILAGLHVFVYPLSKTHYGTGEQVLIEAMACGAVPVVLNNGCERSVVRDGQTGIVAAGRDEFVRAILFLRDNPEVRERMAAAGKRYVAEQFRIEDTLAQWHELYDEAMQRGKRNHFLRLREIGSLPIASGASLLLNAYGDSLVVDQLLALTQNDGTWRREDMSDLPPSLFCLTRGSPFHYQDRIPGDPALDRLCRSLKNLIPQSVPCFDGSPRQAHE